jgi:hypothetical protein
MKQVLRVGIVARRYASPGGEQTCFMELIEGLNEMGIVPDIVWDEPLPCGRPAAVAGLRSAQRSSARFRAGWQRGFAFSACTSPNSTLSGTILYTLLSSGSGCRPAYPTSAY